MRARRSSGRVATTLATALLMLAAAGCSFHGLQGAGAKGYVTGDGSFREIPAAHRSAPVTLVGKDLDGKPISLATMRGKPTVITVWGSWCASCHADSPLLVSAAKQLGSTANFVGIDSRDSGTAQAKAYDQRYGISWPSFFSPGGQALLSFPGVITPSSIPATIVLDARGRPAAAINGALPSSLTLVQMVQDVLRHG